MKLTFFDIYSMTSTVLPQTYSFRLNSLYDPDYTGGGKQPYLYDQLFTAIFRYYTVVNVKVTLKMINTSITNCLVGFFPSVDSSVLNSDLNLYPQYPSCVTKTLTPNLGVDPFLEASRTYKIASLLNVPEKSWDLRSLWNTNPNVVLYLHLFSQALDYTTSTVIYFTIQMEFDVVADGNY